MIPRRSRFQVKPNLGRSSQSQTSTPVIDQPKSPRKALSHDIPPDNQPISDQQPVITEQVVIDDIEIGETEVTNGVQIEANAEEISVSLSPKRAVKSPHKAVVAVDFEENEVESLNSTNVAPVGQQTANVNSRTKLTGTEKLDRSTFRMSDLVFWNPKNEQGLLTPGHEGKKSNRGRKRIVTQQESPVIVTVPQSSVDTKKEENKSWAPQVKLDSEGRLVVDESSLVVRHPGEGSSDNMEIVDRTYSRRISSLTFKKRHATAARAWTDEETEFFYRILQSTGTDFMLMNEFFKGRTREQLRNKYRREMKNNSDRVNGVLKNPTALDNELYVVSAERDKVLSRKARRKSDDEDDICSDLEEEARREIAKLEAMIDKPARSGRARKLRRLCVNKEEEMLENEAIHPIIQQVLTSVRETVEQQQQQQQPPINSSPKQFPGYEPVFQPAIRKEQPEPEPETSTSASASSDQQSITVNIPDVGAVRMTPAPNGESSHVIIESRNESGQNTRYVLVHERSKVTNEPDMVHVYMLSHDQTIDNAASISSQAAISPSSSHMRPLIVQTPDQSTVT